MSAPAVAKYEKGEIKPNSEKLIEFAKAYNVKSSELLKIYSLPKMEFISFRKRKRLVGQNLDLLEEIIQTEVAKYLEIVELNTTETATNKIKPLHCSSIEQAEECAEKLRK
jgi:transcriptional regulator with XRE-family HTH domain